MKRILLLFALFFAVHNTFAQVIKYSVVAGVNESTASDIPDAQLKGIAAAGQTFPNSKLTGFHVGVFADYLMGNISIEPGLLYSTKGGVPLDYRQALCVEDFSRKDVLRLDYLEVPLNVALPAN